MKKRIYIVLPTLRISGGNLEAFQLGEELQQLGHCVNFVIMWKSLHETKKALTSKTYLTQWENKISRALLQLPLIMMRFSRFVSAQTERDKAADMWIFTHFSTYPLALCVARQRRWFFVQGLEWKFVKNAFISKALYHFMLHLYKTSHVLTANSYLSSVLDERGIKVRSEVPIWANEQFLKTSSAVANRPIDFVMVLRKGNLKRLDLYVKFMQINREQARYNWKLAVITPEDEISELAKKFACESHVRPSIEEMKAVYARSRYFLLFSDHEGFGLPPLEAMGSGCVPICRDAGGIRAYMTGELKKNIVPMDWDINAIVLFLEKAKMDLDVWVQQSKFAQQKFIEGLALRQDRLNILAQLFDQSISLTEESI